jgi:hypothetical protein
VPRHRTQDSRILDLSGGKATKIRWLHRGSSPHISPMKMAMWIISGGMEDDGR